jgi:hypothetical protein
MSQLAEFRARLKTQTGNYIDCAISLAADAAAGGFSETIIPAVEHALFAHNIGYAEYTNFLNISFSSRFFLCRFVFPFLLSIYF